MPLVVSETPQPDDTFWICFPSDVLPSEDHMEWIVHGPKFGADDEEERRSVSSSLVEIAAHLRTAHINLMTAEHPDEPTRILASGIISHLEKGANDIARADQASLSLAIWELNFACEKAIKTYIRGRGIKPPNTHDIRRLHQIATTQGGFKKALPFSAMPSVKQVIKHRYSELTPPTLTEAIAIYRAALTIVDEYTKRLSRKLVFDNARLQLKRPLWLKMANQSKSDTN